MPYSWNDKFLLARSLSSFLSQSLSLIFSFFFLSLSLSVCLSLSVSLSFFFFLSFSSGRQLQRGPEDPLPVDSVTEAEFQETRVINLPAR